MSGFSKPTAQLPWPPGLSVTDDVTTKNEQVYNTYLDISQANDPYITLQVQYQGHSGAEHLDLCFGNPSPEINGDQFLIEYAESEHALIFRTYYAGSSTSDTYIDGNDQWTWGQPHIVGTSLPALNGTTAGVMGVLTTNQQRTTAHSPCFKKYGLFFKGYENTTATAQTYNLSYSNTYQAFTNNPPLVLSGISGFTPSVNADGKTLTLPASMSAPVTGTVVIEGW